jgi:putative Mg2+ transporter-C (MgtC) family protein
VASLEWYEIAGRLALAALFGGLIGLGREYDGQDAGFRTHMLVVVGSAVFGVVSVGAFDAFVAERASTNVTVDVTRIAAYVAPGIGFIGGGAILKYGGHVTGITTAASLWSAAAIGVAVGVGFWPAGAVATGLTLVALEVLRPVSRYASRLGRRRRAAIAMDLREGADLGVVVASVRSDGVRIRALRYGAGPGERSELTVEFWDPLRDVDIDAIAARLAGIDGVSGIRFAANA